MDNPRVSSKWLFNIVEILYFDYWITNFYIDEIHKYLNWNQELKNIYDSFPNIKILFSGSSSIDILKWTYDLSRRALVFKLNPLSFREYLNITHNYSFDSITLDDIFLKTKKLDELFLLLSKIPLLDNFKEYISFWEFPFFKEWTNNEYIIRLENLINKIIYEDIVSFYKLKTENIIHLKQIIYFILNSEPWLFSVNSISKFLKISNDSANNYVNILTEIWLLNFVSINWNISQNIRKAKKVYLSITNINSIPSFKLLENENKWRIREWFIVSNLINIQKDINYLKKWDFTFKVWAKDIVIEVWWINKTNKQIQNIDNSFIVADNISIYKGNKIPMLLFWFLY